MIHQGVGLMPFCELMTLIGNRRFVMFVCLLFFRCVRWELFQKQDVCLHFSPYSLSPKTAWISSTPAFYTLCPKGILHPSYLTLISATHTLHSAFNLGFSPSMGGYLHLPHLSRDAEDSMTLELKDWRPIRIQGDSSGRQN